MMLPRPTGGPIRATNNRLEGDNPAMPKPSGGPVFGAQPPKAINPLGGGMTPPTGPFAARPNTFKHGGKVEKTGLALVHEGEHIMPKEKKTEDVHLSQHRVVMHLHKGGLHRALGIPEGTDIPKEKIQAATHSDNEHVRKMAELAHTIGSWKH